MNKKVLAVDLAEIQKLLSKNSQQEIVLAAYENKLKELEDQLKIQYEISDRSINAAMQWFSIINSLPHGFILYENGKILEANDAFLEIIGLQEKKQLLHHNIFEFISQESQEKVQKILKNPQEESYRIKIYSISGTPKTVEIHSRPFKGAANQRVAHIIDVTELEKKEDELKKHYAIYDAFFSCSPVAAYIFQDFKFVTVSDHLCNILGYSKEELLAMNTKQIFEIVYKEDRFMLMQQILKKLKGDNDSERNYDFRFYDRNKNLHYALLFSTVVPFNNKPAIFAQLIDITEKNLEHARAEFLIDKSHVGYMIHDEQGMIYASKQLGHILGYQPEEIPHFYGQDALKYAPEHEQERIKKIIDSKKSGLIESLLLHKSGKYVPVEIHFSKGLILNGKLVTQLSIFDLTDRKKLEYIRYHDAETKLLNAEGLNREIENLLKVKNKSFIIFNIELNLNKMSYHDYNNLLEEYKKMIVHYLAEQVDSKFFDNDIIARTGELEFFIITPAIKKWQDSDRIFDKIIEALPKRYFNLPKPELHIGMAKYPEDCTDNSITNILGKARLARQQAQRQNTVFATFNQDDNKIIQRHYLVSEALTKEVEEKNCENLNLFFQGK